MGARGTARALALGAPTAAGGALFLAALAFAVDPRLGALALAAPAALVILASPAAGTALLLFALPLEQLAALTPGGLFTLQKLLGVAVVGAWLIHTLVQRQPIRFSAPVGWLAALVVWAATSALWAVDPGAANRMTVTLVQLLALYLVVVNTLDTPARLRRALWAHVAGATVLCAIGLYLFGQGILQGGRAAIVVDHELLLEPNGFAAALVLPVAICLAGGLDRLRSPVERAVLVAAGALFVTTVMLTLSRGALLAITVMAVAVGALRRRPLLAVGAALVALPGVVLVGPALWERLAEGATLADRAAGRLDIWRVGWVVIRDHPLLGVGLGGFPLIYFDYLSHATGISWKHVLNVVGSPEKFPHNTYLGTTAELGVVGLALLVLALLSHLRAVSRARRVLEAWHHPAAALVLVPWAALLALLVLGGSLDTGHRKDLWLVLGLAALPGMRLAASPPPRTRTT